ncbi:cyclic nucleotide-binding domain-containing protein [Actinomadura formosensis]|uniref:cyclic nucleotide-binding domain-containing protein n=1 Tax=Actinomadura formosensis TaxID=60706 RepID=UPI003D8D8C48
MAEHARRHDPDQIVRPRTGTAGPSPAYDEPAYDEQAHDEPAYGEPGAENRGLEPRQAARPVSARQTEATERLRFWRSLTNIEQVAFFASAREVVYPAGAVLWSEGQLADRTLVITSGMVRVCVERDGTERIIAHRGPGDIIGERAALELRRRSATVIALDVLHALCMTTQEFAAYLERYPRVFTVMEREMYDRLTEQPGLPQQPGLSQRPYVVPYAVPDARHGYAVRYGPPLPYATGYTSIPPQWPPHPPYAVADPHIVPCATITRCVAPGLCALSAPRPDQGAMPGRHTVEHSRAPVEQSAAQARPRTAVPVPSQAQPTAGTASGSAGPSWAGQNCTIVYTDIAGFSSRIRSDTDRIEVRHAMYAALRESFEESRVSWDACHIEDRGDGALIVVPPGMPTSTVIDPMIASLGMRLRRHNHRSGEPVRIQLRVAIDVGPVMPDPPGVSGWTIITAARLLDAAPLKERLVATGADLGVIASRFVYDSVIAHSPGYVNAAEYEPISCRVKQTDIEGWVYLHGLPERSVI